MAKDEATARLAKVTKLLGLATALHGQLAAVLEEMDEIAGGGAGIAAKVKTVQQIFDAAWGDRYAAAQSGRYVWRHTIDVPNIKRLVKSLGLDEVVLRIPHYLANEDAFVARQRHPFGLFVSGINSYAGAAAAPQDLELDAPTVSDCRHTPRCASDQAHTRRKLTELRT